MIDGFIKVIIDDNSGELLGCHMIVVARKLETT